MVWVDLSWFKLGWVGLDWVGLGWVDLGWFKLIWIDLDCIRTESEDLEDEDEIRDLTAEHTLDHHDHRLEKNLFHLLQLLQHSDLNSHRKNFIYE